MSGTPTTSAPDEARARNPVTWVLVGLVRGYQLIVSPWFPPRCRYYPSCSAYAVTALRRHGPFRGTALAIWRVLRCNPWSLGGVDHVPPRRGHVHDDGPGDGSSNDGQTAGDRWTPSEVTPS